MARTDLQFHFDPETLRQLARTRQEEYGKARPFPHVVIDEFLPWDLIDGVIAEFPAPVQTSWKAYDDQRQRKLEGTDESVMGPITRALFHEFNSSTFVDFLEDLTGIPGLIPDPHLDGGGLHQIERGGFLKVHSDFNWHDRLLLDRRLNLILYLNKGWLEAYGGNLELWDGAMTRCERRILPVANRCVIFNTTDFSNHGHPDPLACPEGMTRKSMALYYFSNGRPTEEMSRVRGTAFAARPGERLRSEESLAKRLVPPLVADWITRSRRRPSH